MHIKRVESRKGFFFVSLLLSVLLSSGCGRIWGTINSSSVSPSFVWANLIAHTMALNFGGVTTPPINTTGASLIIVAECTWCAGTPTPPIDSAGNTWQNALATYGNGVCSTPGAIKMFYSFNPTTSATHTFTDSTSDNDSIAVLAFSGTPSGASVYGTENGSFVTMGATLQPGTVTPTLFGELVVSFSCSGASGATAFSIDSGFNLVDHVHDGSNEDMASAYFLATSFNSLNPTWTFTGDAGLNGVNGIFFPH